MTSIRLPQNIDIQLEKLCGITKRTKSFYIKEALTRYLEDIGDYYIAIDRISAPKRNLLSTDDVIKKLS